ncbi:unnamed protein product [Schistosoma margrebowiei]|uniref:Uncharacterized protein n=1 Tax=Schistosoma margrebowiei TaxID=48269 RepID=A0AA85AIV1_9TREM|nr:unnamed protein product [Schistosoma margrebowiei]
MTIKTILSKYPLTLIITAIYRFLILFTLIILTVMGYQYFYPNENVNFVKLLSLFKSLTVITLGLSIVYFLTATLIQWLKWDKIHSYFYVLVLTYSWVALCMYILVILLHPGILTCNPELKKLPLWFNYICNLIVPVTIMIDAFLWKPKPVRFLISILVCGLLAFAYNIFVEVQINKLQYSMYPALDDMAISCRLLVYFVTWICIFIITFLSYLFIRLLNRDNNIQTIVELYRRNKPKF